MNDVLVAGTATSIGSLPHTDAPDAVTTVLHHHPDLPAAPQLPRRSPAEGMLAQVAVGLRGVSLTDDGNLAVDVDAVDLDAPVDVSFDGDGWAGLDAFLDAVVARRQPVKLQLTGPVTLGMALVQAGVGADRAFDIAAATVRAWGGALVDLVGMRAPHAPAVVLLDEPGLTAVDHPGFPLEGEALIDLLSGALAALSPAVGGVHCCGPTDWRLPMHAGARVLSLPLEPGVIDYAPALAAFLEGGGWVAWGVVPTTGPVGDDPDPLWRRLMSVWCELIIAGCDPALLRQQALVTPVCGLANHGASQADLVLGLASAISARVQDQALAARLSVGA